MSDALVSQLARALNLPPDAARHTLDHLVATLQEQIEATGQARVPGLGTFQRGERGLTFHPDDALARAVNHRYAGLRPIEAGARSEEATTESETEDPFAEEAPASSAEDEVEFQPLDTFVELDEPAEPDEPVEPDEPAEPDDEMGAPALPEETEPESAGVFEGTSTESAIPSSALLEDEAFDEATEEAEFEDFDEEAAADDEADDRSAEVWAPPPAIEEIEDEDTWPTDSEEATEDTAEPEPAVAEEEPDLQAETEAKSEPDFEAAPEAEIEPEAEAEFEAEAEPGPMPEPEAADVLPAAESEPEALDSLDDLALPERDEEDGDDYDEEADTTAILPIMAAPDEPTPADDTADDEADAVAPSPEASSTEAEAVAPAVAATARESAPDKPAKPARRRGAPVVPILIGLAVVLGLVVLFWFLSREPEAPPIAEQPTPADTTETIAAAPPPAYDTAATPTETPAPDADPTAEPTEPTASADPLRGATAIDPADGGFSWVVGSELSREPAERRVAEFRAQGLRAGVIAEEAAGRTRYRVALGQFESIEQAERFRSDLPAGVPADTWLLRL